MRIKHIAPHGFSIIELIVFIVIIGIIGTVILIPLNTMLRDSEINDQATVGMMLANSQMDWRMGQRYQLGKNAFAIFANGASTCTQQICTLYPIPSGYTITTNIATGYSTSTNYKTVTVQAVGTTKSQGAATLKLLIGKY